MTFTHHADPEHKEPNQGYKPQVRDVIDEIFDPPAIYKGVSRDADPVRYIAMKAKDRAELDPLDKAFVGALTRAYLMSDLDGSGVEMKPGKE